MSPARNPISLARLLASVAAIVVLAATVAIAGTGPAGAGQPDGGGAGGVALRPIGEFEVAVVHRLRARGERSSCSWSSRPGRSGSCATASPFRAFPRHLRSGFVPGRGRASSRSPSTPTTERRGASTSTTSTMRATCESTSSSAAADPRRSRARARNARSSPSGTRPSPTTTAASSSSAPTTSSGSRPETAAGGGERARTTPRDLNKPARQAVAHRPQRVLQGRLYGTPENNPFVAARRPTRSGPTACATRGASRSTRRGRRPGDRGRRSGGGRGGSTCFRALAAARGAQLRLAAVRGQPGHSTPTPPGSPPPRVATRVHLLERRRQRKLRGDRGLRRARPRACDAEQPLRLRRPLRGTAAQLRAHGRRRERRQAPGARAPHSPTSFGVDSRGHVYVVSLSGRVSRLAPG